MFSKRLLLFLQFLEIYLLMLRCMCFFEANTSSIRENSSKLSVSCATYCYSRIAVIPLWVSHSTFSSKSSFYPMMLISNFLSNWKFFSFIWTIGMRESCLKSPWRTTPIAFKHFTTSFFLWMLITNSVLNQYFKSFDLSLYCSSARISSTW